MAEAYTKLIELKVKDTDLGRALKKLTTSLDRIEKKLEAIGGKGGKGFTQVSKGADRAAASLKKLQANSTGVAKASGYLRASILGVGAGLVASNAAVTALDKALRRTSVPFVNLGKLANDTTGSLLANKAAFLASTAAVPLLAKALIVGAGAYAVFGSKIFNVKKNLTGFVGNLKTAEKAIRKFVLQVKSPKGELTIFDRIQAAKGGGLVGLRKLLDQVTAAQSKLISTNLNYISSSQQVRAVENALNAELMARKRIMDQIIMGEQARTPTSTLTAAAGQAGGLEGLRTLLAEAQGIQDRMLTTNENYKVASARVKNIQKAINAELERRDKIMGRVNEKEQKSVSLGERLRGLAANVGGKAVQAARPGRGMERRGLLAGGLGATAGLGMFANTGVGQALGSAGNLAAGSMKWGLGKAGFGGTAAGLGKLTTGFKAAAVAAKGVAAANVMNPAFVAALGVAWVAFGNKGIKSAIEKLIGVERAAKKTTASFFKFGKNNAAINQISKELQISKDAMQKLGIAAEKTANQLKRVKSNVRASARGREASGFATWDSDTQTKLAAAKSLERKNKRLIQQGKEALTGERLMTKEMQKQNKARDKAIQKDKRTAKQRLKNWQRIRGQKKESLMLGAGFPLLFGGGVGATAGGVGGAMLGNAMGMGGFGSQILGSALGTMIDTAVQKVTALKQALNQLNMDNLVDSGIRLTGEMQAQVEILKQMGRHDEARAVAAEQIRNQTGLTQGTMGDINNAVNLLKAAWNDVSHSVGGVLGVLAAPFIVALSAVLKAVSLVAQGFNTLSGFLGDVLRKLPGSERLAGAFKRLSQWLANSRKEAILLARAMNKIGDTAVTRASIRDQKHRGLNLTFDQQRENLGFDRNEMTMDFNAETRRLAREIRKKNPNTDVQNRLIRGLNKQRRGEFKLEQQSFTFKEENIDQLEAESLRKLTTKNTMLAAQFEIEKKIVEAKLAGDADTAVRLTFESQKLAIQEKLGEDLRKAKSIEEEVLLVKNALLSIDKARLTVTGHITEAEQKLKNLYEQIGQTVENGLVNAIQGAIDGTKTLGQVAGQVFNQIANSLLKFGVNSLLGGIPGLGDFFRADGGNVTGGEPYMVGERGPELFVPNTSGNIVPNESIGGSSVVVNVDASGSSVEGDAENARALGEMLASAIQAELIQQKRPGGLLS